MPLMRSYPYQAPELFFLKMTVLLVVAITVHFNHASAASITEDKYEFQSTDCWVNPNSDALTECGWITVPEDWENPSEKKLKLPVVIYQARNPVSGLRPVIYFSGGPGVPALGQNGTSIVGWRRSADLIFPGRTLIIFDQRGMGLGSAKLNCPGADDHKIWRPVSNDPDSFPNTSEQKVAVYTACAERLIAGYELTAFNTRQSAADAEALRRALGLDEVILFGISYGTRLALTVMKYYPEKIHAAILDSVFPPQAKYPGEDNESFGKVLDRLFQACEQNIECSVAYPDLREQFARLLERLAKEPEIIEITNLEVNEQGEREPLYVRVDDIMFLEVIHTEMYHSERISKLPVFVSGIARGQFWRLKPYLENWVYNLFGDKADTGATISVICNDDTDITYQQPDARDFIAYPYLKRFVMSNYELDFCAIWPTRTGMGNREPVVSEIPTLLLAGELDPSTPVELAKLAAETLSVSHLFTFPANGHVQIEYEECSWDLIGEFLSSPMKRPNPGCLATIRQPAFIIYGAN